MINFNNKIKEARTEKNITQKQLAEMLKEKGIKTSNTAIANWESGLNKPDIETLDALCQILDKDGNYFFSNSDNKRPQLQFDLTGLDEEDIKDIQEYIEFKKKRKKQDV